MQLSSALIVIMISTAKAASPKVTMNGNSNITGMCLSHQKSEAVIQKLYFLSCHYAYSYIITFVQGVQLKSGPLAKPWIFHDRCYL
jgi:hypothetical protein